MSQTTRLSHSLVLLTFLPACVTTHVGSPVTLTTAPVKVSCSYAPDIESKSISGIACSLENHSSSWQDLKIRSVRFPEQTDVTIVSAEDMLVLAEAYQLKQNRDEHNIGMALTGLILTGALVAVGAGDAATSAAGGAAVVTGTAISAGRDINKGYRSAQYGPAVYSREHLLSGYLRIPSEQAIRRQIIVNHPSEKPKTMEICWIEPKEECTLVTL